MKNKNIKNNALKLVGVAALVGTASAHATDGFDPTSAIGLLTAAAVTAAGLVGSFVAISAGVKVWKKISGYFSQAK